MKITKIKIIGLCKDWMAKKLNVRSVLNDDKKLLGRYLFFKPGLSLNQANLVTKFDQLQSPKEHILLEFPATTACVQKSKTHIVKNPLQRKITPPKRLCPKVYIW